LVRRSNSSRSACFAGLALALVAAIALNLATPAEAAAPPSDVTGSANPLSASLGAANPQINVTGPLAGVVGPLLSGSLGTLFGVLQGLPNAVVNPLVATLTGTDKGASTPPDNNAPFTPVGSSAPSPCPAPSCSSAANTAIDANLNGVGLGLSAGTLQGWVQYDDSTATPKIHSASRIENVSLGLLDQSLLHIGTVTSSTDCVQAGASSSTANAAGTSLLDGLVQIDTTGGTLKIKLPSMSSFDVLSEVLPQNLTQGGHGVTLSATPGGALKATVHLGLSDLLAALNLPALPLAISSAVVDLSIVVGTVEPVLTPTTVGQAWGLAVGLDLGVNLKADILGTGVELALPSLVDATHFGNLADLRFGASTCTAGSVLPPTPVSWIPPELS